MKKSTGSRIVSGIIQHTLAAGFLILAAWVSFHSFFSIKTMHGVQTYRINLFDVEPEFENSRIFQEIFGTALEDVIRLAALREEMETNGRYDAHKPVDVNRFAESHGGGENSSVTAVYELEDLIKWGKYYGVEYAVRVMSISDFTGYFGNALLPCNFALDDNGQLYFKGFERVSGPGASGYDAMTFAPAEYYGMTQKEYDAVSAAMSRYAGQEEKLEDMVFSYILREIPEALTVSREDDGMITVAFRLLTCRYETAGEALSLLNCADNWVDYMRLQANVAKTIERLGKDYELYENSRETFAEDTSNLKYLVRMQNRDGESVSFTNVSGAADLAEDEAIDFFEDYRRYLIYYPDDLNFMGNLEIDEDQIYRSMEQAYYPSPEKTRIWIGVDTGYSGQGDAFFRANALYQRIIPSVRLVFFSMGLMAVGWLLLVVYLTVTAGTATDGEGEKVSYLNRFDRCWLEVFLLLAALFVYGSIAGYQELRRIAGSVYESTLVYQEMNSELVRNYAIFGGYGWVVSMFSTLFWYSAVRRVKSFNLWRDSFLHWLCIQIGRSIRFILRHRNTAVSMLVPYNLFLFVNLGAFLGCYLVREDQRFFFLILAAIVVFDVSVGMSMFRQRAEQIDIVEGITRIRNGEVDYKLDAQKLHGTNRELADAVNNIGEGIRNAVQTSMKDEQMKTDLITNVSHDIKTPLTSIINYVDLLKRQRIEEEPARGYIEILDSKAQRLRQLTDDLVEVSRISSGNIVLNLEQLNLTELVNQTVGEFSERFEERRLTLLAETPPTAMIFADSRRMWRIMENLFHNICKYAMEGTRVYLTLAAEGEQPDASVVLTLKNISAEQMNISPEELTERFIRGDSSRTTEGSGLGLSIAKSLTKVQGGTFEIGLDGDLFKVVLSFPEYRPPEVDPDGQTSVSQSES